MSLEVPSPGRCNKSEFVRDHLSLSGSRNRNTMDCSILTPRRRLGRNLIARGVVPLTPIMLSPAIGGILREDIYLQGRNGVMVNGSTSLESGISLVDRGWLPDRVAVPGREVISSCPSLPVHASLIKKHQGENWGGG